MSEGTSPSDGYDEGSRSTPSNLPKATTRQKKKKTSDSKHDVFEVEEVTLNMVLLLTPSLVLSRKLLPKESQCQNLGKL